MRAVFVAVVAALLVVLGASSATSARSGAQGLTISLPAVNSAKVVAVTLKSAGMIKVAAVNAAQLGHTLNTQVVADIKPGAGQTFRIVIFIHRFQPIRRVADTDHRAAGAAVQLKFSGPQVMKLLGFDTYSCPELKQTGYLDDSWIPKKSALLINLIADMDSPPEEQVDNTVAAWCPKANPEPDDPDGS